MLLKHCHYSSCSLLLLLLASCPHHKSSGKAKLSFDDITEEERQSSTLSCKIDSHSTTLNLFYERRHLSNFEDGPDEGTLFCCRCVIDTLNLAMPVGDRNMSFLDTFEKNVCNNTLYQLDGQYPDIVHNRENLKDQKDLLKSVVDGPCAEFTGDHISNIVDIFAATTECEDQTLTVVTAYGQVRVVYDKTLQVSRLSGQSSPNQFRHVVVDDQENLVQKYCQNPQVLAGAEPKVDMRLFYSSQSTTAEERDCIKFANTFEFSDNLGGLMFEIGFDRSEQHRKKVNEACKKFEDVVKDVANSPTFQVDGTDETTIFHRFYTDSDSSYDIASEVYVQRGPGLEIIAFEIYEKQPQEGVLEAKVCATDLSNNTFGYIMEVYDVHLAKCVYEIFINDNYDGKPLHKLRVYKLDQEKPSLAIDYVEFERSSSKTTPEPRAPMSQPTTVTNFVNRRLIIVFSIYLLFLIVVLTLVLIRTVKSDFGQKIVDCCLRKRTRSVPRGTGDPAESFNLTSIAEQSD